MNINVKPTRKKPRGVPVTISGSVRVTPLTLVLERHRTARQKHITAKRHT